MRQPVKVRLIRLLRHVRHTALLSLGAFDEPQRYRPTAHWNIETAMPYEPSDDGLPRHRQADSKFQWVRDSAPKG